MENFTENILKVIFNAKEIIGPVLGPAVPYFQWLAILLSGALLWGCIYSIVRSGYLTSRKEYYMDYLGVGDIGRWRRLRAWNQIVERSKSPKMENWKLAIMEADKITDEIIKSAGFRAETMDERMDQVGPEVIPNIEELREIHKIRHKIAREPDFKITREETIEILKTYKKTFQEMGLLD